MEDKTDNKKRVLVLNVVDFLQNELETGNLNDERKESVEVAIQCLETAFDLTACSDVLAKEKINLLEVLPAIAAVDVTEEAKAEAEDCKNRGNARMRSNEYVQAVNEYSMAIKLNPYNAVYYCNRAAAYSRLEKHVDSILDCKEAIKLDPTYSKAYSRLGIAYSNLNKFEEARAAYVNALKYDPKNEMYETNLKLAEERLLANMVSESAAPPEHRPVDISQFINNPNLINMATQMLTDPNFRNIMTGIMSMNNANDSNFDALLQAGQTLANRMQTANPSFVDNLRRSLDPNLAGDGNAAAGDTASSSPNGHESEESKSE